MSEGRSQPLLFSYMEYRKRTQTATTRMNLRIIFPPHNHRDSGSSRLPEKTSPFSAVLQSPESSSPPHPSKPNHSARTVHSVPSCRLQAHRPSAKNHNPRSSPRPALLNPSIPIFRIGTRLRHRTTTSLVLLRCSLTFLNICTPLVRMAQ